MNILKRLYVENYKLFSKKELDFSNALLSVFDGPNGYGKTSIFDAIELLITGKISRVVDCESIDGKVGYETVFFAQNHAKDVIIKAEFEDDKSDRCLVLGARVKSVNVNGKPANPKNIFENVEFFNLPKYDISIDSWDDYLVNFDDIEKLRKREFGKQNVEQFTLFHYIRQEDRLAYFKQSETSRATTIEDLLGVATERKKFKDIQTKRKALDKLFKQITNIIKDKKESLIDYDVNTSDELEYEPLIDGTRAWDKEFVLFGNSNQDKVLAQYFTELEKLESYANFGEIHNTYFAYTSFTTIDEKVRNNALLALILLHKSPISIDDIDISFQNLNFLKQQQDKIEAQDYKSVNYSKLCNILGVPEDENIIAAINTLCDISKNQGELQAAINNVIQIRENLNKENSQIKNEGICPYCGYNWANQEDLEEKFLSTKEILQNLLTQDGDQYAKQLKIVREKIEASILENLKKKISEISNNEIVSIYAEFDSKAKFISAIENVKPMYIISLNRLDVNEIQKGNVNDNLKKIIEKCVEVGNNIPPEYLVENEKYTFLKVMKDYTLNDEIISKLRQEDFHKKRKYIQEQYYRSFDKLKEEIRCLETKRDTIEIAKTQLKEYENALKNAIDSYKKQIIDEIEIPFFVYSSRLLQSYQGGQGVLMKNDGDSIRFTSPGKEHDILYTMSSGQLSAVLLSFSLALNKIYSGQGIKTVLIDDPIQCMDDINMISFVELLRREFSGCQIIMSTHEEDFSDFVRYKFKKYGLKAQAITLKDA